MKRKYLWGVIYGCLLAAFTVYVALDTFVIERVYAVVETEISAGQTKSVETAQPESTQSESTKSYAFGKNGERGDMGRWGGRTEKEELTENRYEDENMTVEITQYRQNDTTIYVADVQIAEAGYLKTALAQNAYGRNVTEKTSEMAERVGAILAVNGDYYGARGSGYVIRNGVLYRNEGSGADILVIYQDGSFEIISEDMVSAETLLENGAMQTLCFGPALVEEGEVVVSRQDEVGKAAASNPRTGIAVIDDLHYIFVVSDGRTSESEGLSLHELAVFMQELGAETAYNLDGGGSSTMVFQGALVNTPTTSGRNLQERSVSDIVYIGY